MAPRIAPGAGLNLLGQHSAERNQDATVYVANLDPRVTEDLLWELFVQAGPVASVYVPKDKVTGRHQGYGFVEFVLQDDVDYAVKVVNERVVLYGRKIRTNRASNGDAKGSNVGANIFIGNLDADVDENVLYDAFSKFGVALNPKVMRDPNSGNSRGFGFVSFDCFEASDEAIQAMNGQYLCNRQITVSYAYKKDTKGERHGTLAERVLASSFRKSGSRVPAQVSRVPNQQVTGRLAMHQLAMPPPMRQMAMPPHQHMTGRPPMQQMAMLPPQHLVGMPPMHQVATPPPHRLIGGPPMHQMAMRPPASGSHHSLMPHNTPSY